MKKLILIGVLVITFISISGYIKYHDIEKAILDQNRETDFVFKSYEESLRISKELEEKVKLLLFNRDSIKMNNSLEPENLRVAAGSPLGHLFDYYFYDLLPSKIDENAEWVNDVFLNAGKYERMIEKVEDNRSDQSNQSAQDDVNKDNGKNKVDEWGNVMDLDNKEFFYPDLEVRYFLDSNTGKLEQLFYFHFANGEVSGISLFWLSGDLIEIKAWGV